MVLVVKNNIVWTIAEGTYTTTTNGNSDSVCNEGNTNTGSNMSVNSACALLSTDLTYTHLFCFLTL